MQSNSQRGSTPQLARNFPHINTRSAAAGRPELREQPVAARPVTGRFGVWFGGVMLLLQCVLPGMASVLFEEDFTRSFAGWTVVQPPANYLAGPLRWEYEMVNGAFVEQSNIYTDAATYSPSATAPMLINDTVTGASFTYTARLTAGDDDGFGLIFGYQNETNFYRVVFTRQADANRVLGFPWVGTTVDRKENGATSIVVGPSGGFTNTANRPFDVTIAVDAMNRLSLTVVDNPLVAPVARVIANNLALPTSASGRVGIFTWGMSGGTPPAFRIQKLSLSPLALTGTLGMVTNWTALIPPRMATSSAAITGTPYWFLTPLQNGLVGALNETGDCFGGNDAAGQVDFTGPTLVGGSETWSNCVLATRIIPYDDDAQGVVLRYRNPSNFWRIALRTQVSTIGPPPGLSVQKNVNQIYSEVYRDNPVTFSPVSGQPYDLLAEAAMNTLKVTVVADPEGAAQVYTYGPFNITGVNTGKVGLLSWAMSKTAFESVSVQDGAALYVSSPAGSPSPGRGLISFVPGTLVNATCGGVSYQSGLKWIPVGWVGSGSVPPSGSGTNVSFVITNFSRLHWQWQPELPATNGLMVYLNFDNNLDGQQGTIVDGTVYPGGATNGPRYRGGVIGAAANFANDGSSSQPSDWAVSLGSLEAIYSNSFSVSFWERSASGVGALMGNKPWDSVTNVGWVISMSDGTNVNWSAVGGTNRMVDLNPPFSDGDWHLVTVTFNRESNEVLSYIDGALVLMSVISPSGWASLNAGTNTLVGGSGNGIYAGAGDIDDLGIWNRVVPPEEVAAIYAAGLIGNPLNLALPGQAPVIVTNLPASVVVAPGGSVTLSVAVSGPGTFTYQWRLNGVAIPGATNATLSLSGIDSSNEGVYTVLVSNGSGGALSTRAVLTVDDRLVTGQWDFLASDVRATVGTDLEYVGDTTNQTAFPVMNINGTPVRVMAFGGNAPSQGYVMWHGAMPNGGGRFVNRYTLIMDVMFPASSSGQWRALFQSDPFNHPANDAEFYVGGTAASPAPNGIGAEDHYDGTLAPDTWYRIAFAVDLTASAGQQLNKYVNGVPVGQQALSGGVDGRFALGPAAQLFTSGLAGAWTQPGYVSSIQFVNGCLTPAAIAALGGPSPGKLPPGDAVIRITDLSLNESQLSLNWGGPSGSFQVQDSPTLSPPLWQSVGTPSTNRSLTLPATNEMSFYRVTQSRPDIKVGQLPYGEQSIPSKEILRAAGSQVQFAGLPVDLALSPDGQRVYIKNNAEMWVVDAASWTLLQMLDYPSSGASMHGIAVSPDGTHVYVTGSGNELYDWTTAGGLVSYSRTISLASSSDPCGLAISADGTKAYVCLSKANRLAVVNLTSGTVSQQIPVGIAPWDVVLSPDGNTAYVSDWGGRYPVGGDLTMTSAGTPVVVDARGLPTSGVVSVVNLISGIETAQVATGLHPSDLVLSPDGGTLYVANANSDTVTVIDTQTKTVRETILVRPSSTLPFGSSSTLPFGSQTDGLALSADGTNLFVAVAGNNAIAVVELPNTRHTNSVVQGFLPTDWYPGAVVADDNYIYVANVKGLGTRYGQPKARYNATGNYLGTANRIPIPSAEALSKYSAQVNKNTRLSHIQQAQRPPRSGQTPVPVPAHAGEPSVFQHVLYILKENKTYDQIFGDLPQGNCDPSLCVYPRLITPNHHALAEQYVLLDNYYCNGVNSAVGHAWSTQGDVVDGLEKSFGGFVRSYPYRGEDPLCFAPTGFIWNNVLQHGLTFRNYNEFTTGTVPSGASWYQLYADYTNGTHAIATANTIHLASLAPYTSTNVPGWNMNIPDVVRAYGFIKELTAAQASGNWATFHFLWLPVDHTGGAPPAQAQVADNDLALGQVVEAVTKSRFGSNTVIFVVEDDPQSGWDHVDGHRSICLVISPYTRRNQVINTFYNQAGVLHTMERIMGLPPMNQADAMAPIMFDCFTNVPDFTPYTALPNNIDLAAGGTVSLSSKARYYAKKVKKMDLSRPDRIDDDIFNRYIWHSIKGNARYPSEFAGSHGKGLKQLGLVLDPTARDLDD